MLKRWHEHASPEEIEREKLKKEKKEKGLVDTPFNPFNVKKVQITTSQTWVVPKTGRYLVVCIGGGGSGAVIGRGGDVHGYRIGGYAGLIVGKLVELNAGDEIPITIGSGGGCSGVGTYSNNGKHGGTTKFGDYVSAQGGRGGIYNNSLKADTLLPRKRSYNLNFYGIASYIYEMEKPVIKTSNDMHGEPGPYGVESYVEHVPVNETNHDNTKNIDPGIGAGGGCSYSDDRTSGHGYMYSQRGGNGAVEIFYEE